MLELRLKQVWESVLKVRPVGVRDNFFEVGGHSMLAVKLMGEVQKLTQEPLPLGHLFKYPTIEQMASLLRGTSKPSSHGSLVEIQPGGSRKPFFCVHPVGGNVLCYHDLARHLGQEQPFYGLQAKGLEGEQEPYTNIELMAARYLEEVRAVQAEGPYLIGGWSMGGVVAFEMAQQLRAQGQEVGLLALIDSMYTSSENAARGDDGGAMLLDLFAANLAGTFNVNLPALTGERLAKLQTEERLTFILDEAKKAGVIPPSFDLQQIRALLKVFVANFEALHSYVPKPYAGPLTIFAASESIVRQARNNIRGWEALAQGPLSVHELPGNHFTIINKTHVQTLAAQIKTCLAQITDARRDGTALNELIPVA
jgi:thioesterase domain-containing protein